MNNWPSHSTIKNSWPDGISYSMYKAKIIRKIILNQYRGWVENRNTDLLRMFIRDHFLKFKPANIVFDCETIDYESILSPIKTSVKLGYTRHYPRLNQSFRKSK